MFQVVVAGETLLEMSRKKKETRILGSKCTWFYNSLEKAHFFRINSKKICFLYDEDHYINVVLLYFNANFLKGLRFLTEYSVTSVTHFFVINPFFVHYSRIKCHTIHISICTRVIIFSSIVFL